MNKIEEEFYAKGWEYHGRAREDLTCRVANKGYGPNLQARITWDPVRKNYHLEKMENGYFIRTGNTSANPLNLI